MGAWLWQECVGKSTWTTSPASVPLVLLQHFSIITSPPCWRVYLTFLLLVAFLAAFVSVTSYKNLPFFSIKPKQFSDLFDNLKFRIPQRIKRILNFNKINIETIFKDKLFFKSFPPDSREKRQLMKWLTYLGTFLRSAGGQCGSSFGLEVIAGIADHVTRLSPESTFSHSHCLQKKQL